MANKTYYIGDSNSEVLRIHWTAGYKYTTIFHNGTTIATVDKEGLKIGKRIILPNGKELDIQLKKSIFAILETKINGQHIPRSFGDPYYMLSQIFWLLAILGTLNFAIGIGIAFAVGGDDAMWIGLLNAFFGLAQIGSGYGIRKQLFAAQILATLLMASDLLLSIYYAGSQQSFIGNIPMIIKATFLLYIIRGFYAFKEIKKTQL